MRLKKAAITLSMLSIAGVAPVALAAGCTDEDSAQTLVQREIGGATDSNSREDFSFNSQAFDVVKAFTANPNNFLESGSDIKSSYKTLASNGVKTILAAGSFHREPILSALKESDFPQDVNFILLDEKIEAGGPGAPTAAQVGRVLNVNFKSEQGGFLSGYLAAAKAVFVDPVKPVVYAYGGMDFPAVAAFMGGFQQGVKFYNDTLAPTTKVAMYRSGNTRADFFKGDFSSVLGNEFSGKILDAFRDDVGSVDVIFPVAGPQGQSILTQLDAWKTTPPVAGTDWTKKFIIGVDADLARRNPGNNSVLTSALKNIATVLTTSLNTLYGTDNAVPTVYPAANAALKSLVNNLVKDGNPKTLFGNSLLGGINEGFVGVPTVTEQNLETLVGKPAADRWTEAKTAAAALTTDAFDHNFVV